MGIRLDMDTCPHHRLGYSRTYMDGSYLSLELRIGVSTLSFWTMEFGRVSGLCWLPDFLSTLFCPLVKLINE
jgi:hypothetical protein